VADSQGLQREVYRLAQVKLQVVDELVRRHPGARFSFTCARLEGLAYYSGLCLRISAETADGARYPLVDGGMLDWTARLLQDRKERFLATGMGTEFVCARYGIPAPGTGPDAEGLDQND
jgi:hypothetical protein